MIRIEKLKKKISADFTLDIPSLTVDDGERVALIGPNGAGKSTLLRLIAGLTKPDEGLIEVSAPTGSVGYEPQSPFIFRGSAEKNVRLSLRDKADLDSLFSDCDIANLRKKRADRLSGGEKQRVCLARMLAGNYRVLLLDEPLSAADVETGERLSGVILRYCETAGATLIFSTHLPRQAQQIATKIIILTNGSIAEYGDAGALSSPESEFGKRFLAQWAL